MPRYVGYVATVIAVAACSTSSHPAGPDSVTHPAALLTGVDTQYIDDSVRPQDDLYRHLNGKGLGTFEIPADKGAYNAFTHIDDTTQEQLRVIVEGLAASNAGGLSASSSDGSAAAAAPGADAQKIADLYASFMDEARLETLGLAPLKTALAEIDALSSKQDIPALIARFNRTA